MNKEKILKKILRTERTMSEISERVDRCKIKYEELEKELKLLYADLHMPYSSSINLLDLPFLEKLSGRNSKRDIFIMKEWNEDLNSTLQSIADKHDLTRERVRQILEKWEDIGYPIREPKDMLLSPVTEHQSFQNGKKVSIKKLIYGKEDISKRFCILIGKRGKQILYYL